ncbi:MAG: hypothetical protein JST30_12820 [Armatimonadetes bacterium]|nr:hypothetical protein [Armatimonadota bacterium]
MKTLVWIGLAFGIGALVSLGRRKWDEQGRRRHRDRLLDEALEETFPASDPVSIP